MKTNRAYLLLPFIAGLSLLAACKNPNSKQRPQPKDYSVVNADSKNAQQDTVCFEHTEGLLRKDVASITLYFNKADIGGHMIWAPSGKYSSVGTLAGNKKDSLISSQWAYTLKGKEDTVKVNFKLMNDKLYQQPFLKNTNGKMQVDTTADWSVVYNKVNCAVTQ